MGYIEAMMLGEKMMTQATRATLYLGANIQGVYGVTSVDFSDFLTEFVVPHFDGFTVKEALGYWKGQAEHSRELIILAEDGASPFFHDKVELIADAYKTKFQQEAVMISYEPVSVLWDVPERPLKGAEPVNPSGNWA